MYYAAIQQFIHTLGNLDTILEKAIKHAESRTFSPDNYLAARVAPDMLPFSRQIQVACDTAKRTAANLAGKEAPAHEDTEKTMVELRERIAKCVAFLKTLTPEDFAHVTAKTVVKVPNPPGKAMFAEDALFTRALPNFFFHVVTAYDLLRAGGVDVGKKDYLGAVPMFDA